MENAELDVALEELENRLERLRALYEQYFMGIERIEPAIPRKDIDRRIYVLRREKIRNTAKRFKLQTIISRYNTFQQYWQRICREIENGTYKRHVIKAERIAPGKMLTIAARRRLGRRAFEEDGAEPAPSSPQPAAASNAPPAAASSVPPARGSSAPPPPSVPRPAPATAPPTPKAVPPPKPPPKPGARPPLAQPEPAHAVGAKPFESLDLDMDFMGDWDPTGKGARMPAVPARPFGEALSRPLGAAPIAAIKPGAARGHEPAERALTAPKAVAQAAPPKPTAARAPAAQPQAVATSAAVANGPPNAAVPPAQKLGAAPIAKTTAPAATLTDDRVRELHARLIEAKRETKDGAAVSIEGLAKSLKATEAKLREQHKNRRIDFDVVIKDGKAILKPTVR